MAKNIEGNHLYMSYLGNFVINTNYIFLEMLILFYFFHKYIFVKEIGKSFLTSKNILFVEMEYDKVMCTFVISQFSNQHNKSYISNLE